MFEEAKLELSPTVLKKIDENRSVLTRAEFIEVCVQESLKHQEAAPEGGDSELYLTREEFEEFKRGVRNLLHSSLNFFLLYWMELAPETSEEDAMVRGRLLEAMAENG